MQEYLISFESKKLPYIETEILVIGSGIAGLSTAIKAAEKHCVLVITKNKIKENNTNLAQGGIAVVMSKEDSIEKHIEDTLKTGKGLSDKKAVKLLVTGAIKSIEDLIKWGVKFDKIKGEYSFTCEGGHGTRRILHAKGDATGKEILRILYKKVKENKNIKLLEHSFAIDLITQDGICFGVIVKIKNKGKKIIYASKTVLATGGIGQIYRETTNSIIATGDGMSMAYRKGAILTDMEFVQFHPTTLYVAGAARFLISESVRGEGGILINKYGEEFMKKYHKLRDLAPRDIVSKSILQEMEKTNSTNVFLDVRHLPSDFLKKRFPGIRKTCLNFDIDITKDLIPVRPSAHYIIGGIKVNTSGETNIKNLYAVGEVACSYIHGANRLASNSLLEGLVMGEKIGGIISETVTKKRKTFPTISYKKKNILSEKLDLKDIINSLKSLMWRNVSIEREEKKLIEAEKMIKFWQKYVMCKEFFSPYGWELQNLLSVAELITKSALLRKESRGVHYRLDYPKERISFKYHIELKINE